MDIRRSPSGAVVGLGGYTAPTTNSTSQPGSAQGVKSPETTGGSGKKEAPTGRRLTQVVVKSTEDVLDSFRRGWQRGNCAGSAAYSWRMAQIPQQVDVARYRAMVAGHDMVDILAEAARLLKG